MTIPCLFPGRLASCCRPGLIVVTAVLLGVTGCDQPTDLPVDIVPQAAPGGRGNPQGSPVTVHVLKDGSPVAVPDGLVLYLYSGAPGSNPDYILNDTDGDGTITGQVAAGSYLPVIKLVPTAFQGLSHVAPDPAPVVSDAVLSAVQANAFAPVTQTSATSWGCASLLNLTTGFSAKAFVVPPQGYETTVEVWKTSATNFVCDFSTPTVAFPGSADDDFVYSVISRRPDSNLAGTFPVGTLPGILAFVSQVSVGLDGIGRATVVCFGTGDEFGVELLELTQVGTTTSKFNKVGSATPGGCNSFVTLPTEIARCEPTPATGTSPFLSASYGYYFERDVDTQTGDVTKVPNRGIASADLLVDLAGVMYTVTTRTDYMNGGRLTTEQDVLLAADGTCTYVGDIRRSGARNAQNLDVSCQQLGDEYLITAVLSNYSTNRLQAVGMGFKGPNGAAFPSVLGGYFFMTEPASSTECGDTNDPVWSMTGWP